MYRDRYDSGSAPLPNGRNRMTLRRAGEAEFEAVRSFYWALIDQMADRTDTVGWKKGVYPSDAFLAESLRNGELYVFDRDGGYAACVILNSSWNSGYEGTAWGTDCAPEEILVPHALGVLPDLHGQGIGTLMVKEIIRLAEEGGKKTVRLDILKGNTAAERLYAKTGFRPVQTKTMYYPDTGWTEFTLYERIL